MTGGADARLLPPPAGNEQYPESPKLMAQRVQLKRGHYGISSKNTLPRLCFGVLTLQRVLYSSYLLAGIGPVKPSPGSEKPGAGRAHAAHRELGPDSAGQGKKSTGLAPRMLAPTGSM